MLAIVLTQPARSVFQKYAKDSLQSFIELDAKLFVVFDAGLVGEPLIAVVDHGVDVYLLEPARPAPLILMIHDPATPAEVTVTGFPPCQPSGRSREATAGIRCGERRGHGRARCVSAALAARRGGP